MPPIIIHADYPDPDVIRVDDVYYLISTTMHFFPGGTILRSYDLVNWEFCTNLFEHLDDTQGQRLVPPDSIYGQGMWAASLRHHQDKFYVCFSANDTQRTYIYQTKWIESKCWTRTVIEGLYHDASLYFEDNRVFLVHGNTNIYLTELTSDVKSVKGDGLNHLLISDTSDTNLGYEGSHFYKIGRYYYLFVIHWPKAGFGRRVQSCFRSESLTGKYTGQIVFDDDNGYFNLGIAQGGIVDAPQGNWYTILFQDVGAAGRVPVLLPLTWEDEFPLIGKNGKVPEKVVGPQPTRSNTYTPLVGNDFVKLSRNEGNQVIADWWQWNHQPDPSLWQFDPQSNSLLIRTNQLVENIIQAKNTLTQRALIPHCSASVRLDGALLKEGDFAGLAAFQSFYGFIALTKEKGQYYLVLQQRLTEDQSVLGDLGFHDVPSTTEKILLGQAQDHVEVSVSLNFTDRKDQASFYYRSNGQWQKIGKAHQLYFKLDHFTGCRFALCTYATKEIGGIARFSDFKYDVKTNKELK